MSRCGTVAGRFVRIRLLRLRIVFRFALSAWISHGTGAATPPSRSSCEVRPRYPDTQPLACFESILELTVAPPYWTGQARLGGPRFLHRRREHFVRLDFAKTLPAGGPAVVRRHLLDVLVALPAVHRVVDAEVGEVNLLVEVSAGGLAPSARSRSRSVRGALRYRAGPGCGPAGPQLLALEVLLTIGGMNGSWS